MARSFSKDSNDQAAGTLKRCESKCHPDSCWSWVVCAASTLSKAIVAGVSYSFGLLLPTLTEGFEERRQTTAWVGSLYVACGCIFSPVGCHVSDRFGHKFTAILGSFFGIIGFFLASFSSKLWMMYLAYGVLSGIGHMMVYNSCYLMVLLYFVKCRSLAVGIVSSAPAIGMFVTTQVTQFLLDTWGWRWAVRGFGLLNLVCGLCSMVFVPFDNGLDETFNSKLMTNKPREKEATKQSSSLCGNYSFVIISTSVSVVHFSYQVPIMHIVKHCKQELQIPGKKASMLYTYMAITSFISRHLFCKLGDLEYLNRFHLYQGGMIISGLCVLCLPLARSFGSIVAIFTVFGLMDGAMNGQYALLLLECTGRHQVNRAWGYMMLFSGLSVGLGSPLAGLLADEVGSYTISFYTAGAIHIAGVLITSFMTCVKRGLPEEGETQTSIDEELLVTEKLTVV